MYIKQLVSLLKHKWYVLKAGWWIGDIPLWRLIIHDWSKFTPIEFINYAQFKYGEKTLDKWALAWLHHLHHNPHHPEHWVLSWRGNPNFYDGFGEPLADFVTVLPVPKTYVREMVADMLATSKEMTGYWDIAIWLNANGPNMNLHADTTTHLDAIMIEKGYFITDNCDWSYMAGSEFREWAQEFQ